MPRSAAPPSPTARVVLGVLIAVVAGHQAWHLGRLAGASSRLPFWDEAKYGTSGLRLADALRGFDFPAWLVEVHGLDVWPPLHPLATSLGFLALGDGWATPRLVVVGCYALAILASWWAGCMLGGRQGAAAGALAAAWLASGPMFRAFATLGMLEIPTTLWLAVAVAAHARALRLDGVGDAGRDRLDRTWLLAWSTATVVFFCKFNYGLIFLAAAGLSEARIATGSWRRLAAEAWSRALEGWRYRPWRRPWPLTVAACALLVIWIRLGGGIDHEIFGVTLRVTSVGSPLSVLLALGATRWLVRARFWSVAGRTAWLAWRSTLPSRQRRALDCVVLPVGLWLLLPPHLRELTSFVGNRSSDLDLVEGAELYARALVDLYAPVPWLGIVVGLAGLSTIGWIGGRDARRRFLGLLVLLLVVALLAHPYKLPRFGLPAFWCLGLAAALMWERLWVRSSGWLASARSRAGRPVIRRPRAPSSGAASSTGAVSTGVATALAVGAVLAVIATTESTAGSVWRLHRAYTVPAAASEVVDHVTREIVRRPGPIVVLGTWNGLSPPLIEWRLRALGEPVPDLEMAIGSSRDDRCLAQALQSPGPKRVLRLSPLDGAAGERLDQAEMRQMTTAQAIVDGWLEDASTAARTIDRPRAGYRVEMVERMNESTSRASGG
ncbi:MAG: hypothetical protein AAGN46_03285 [Acidobacteriota bacterium]